MVQAWLDVMASTDVFSTHFRMRFHGYGQYPSQDGSRGFPSPKHQHNISPRPASSTEFQTERQRQKSTTHVAPLPDGLTQRTHRQGQSALQDVNVTIDETASDARSLAERLSRVEQTQNEVLQRLDALPDLIAEAIKAM